MVTGLAGDGAGCEPLRFEPTRLIDGFERSDDQILAARGLAYRVSADDRHATDVPDLVTGAPGPGPGGPSPG